MENSCLWAKTGQERSVLIGWLNENRVEYDEDMSTEELRQLYIRKETSIW